MRWYDQRHSDALEYQRAVRTTKTKIILDCKFNFGIARRVGAEIQIALGILIKEVDSRGNFLVVQSQHRKNRLNPSRAT